MHLPTLLILIAFTKYILAILPDENGGSDAKGQPTSPETRKELARLTDELRECTRYATEGIRKRKALLKEARGEIERLKKLEQLYERSNERQIEQMNALEREINEMVKNDCKILTQIFRETNVLVLENEALGDNDTEDVFLAKIEETKNLAIKNNIPLAELDRDYNDLDEKFKRVRVEIDRDSPYNAKTYYNGMKNNEPKPKSHVKTPPREKESPSVDQNPTEDELHKLFQSDVLEFSKKELATVAKTLKTLTDDFLKKITKDENEATLSVDRTMAMSLNMEDLVESHNIIKVQREYELFVKYKEHVRELYRSIMKDITDLRRKIEKSFDDLKVCQMKLSELGDSVPEELQKVCVGTFRAVLRILERYKKRGFEWSQKLGYIFVDSNAVEDYFGIVSAHIERVKRDEASADSQEEAEKPAEPPAGAEATKEAPEKTEGAATEEQDAKKDEEENKNLRMVFVKKHVPKEKDGAMQYGFNLVLILATFVMWA